MLRVEKRAPPDISDSRVVRRLSLPFEIRQKRRFRALLEDGTQVAIFLPRSSRLMDGDRLEADDGSLIKIVAAPEPLLYVTASSCQALVRAAYHLGNRHTPVEVGDGFLKLENDSVLKQMLDRLEVYVREAQLPFQPESGAYGGGHGHEFQSENEPHLPEHS
jgi:urease accessory protein